MKSFSQRCLITEKTKFKTLQEVAIVTEYVRMYIVYLTGPSTYYQSTGFWLYYISHTYSVCNGEKKISILMTGNQNRSVSQSGTVCSTSLALVVNYENLL